MLEELRITGGSALIGEIPISGAKNAALPILTAALLTDQTMHFHNVPVLTDIESMRDLLRQLGAEVVDNGHHQAITFKEIKSYKADYEVVRKMRASIVVLGPLLARYGKACVSMPGGCAIGARPIDLHLMGLSKLGAQITLEDGYIHATAPNGLTGAEIEFHTPTVVGTENVMMAAALARGITTIKNAAREPEVVDLAECLIKMGAKIFGFGTSTIRIEGVEKLNGISHTIIPDRHETATYAIAALMTRGRVKLLNTKAEYLKPLTDHFDGIIVEESADGIVVKGQVTNAKNITTMPYPGFPTDLQAQAMALMTQIPGEFEIDETIWENRFMHVPELNRMGAQITVRGGKAHIIGGTLLKGAPVMATDLRASASLVLAALVAKGETVIKRIYHLDRGYEDLDGKLGACGVGVTRTKQAA